MDTDVQNSFNIFYKTVTDKNIDTNGYLGGKTHRDDLQDALKILDEQAKPTQPTSSINGVSTFNVAVNAGDAVTLDPAIAVGFDYKIGNGDPLFASVTLPTLGTLVTKYHLSGFAGGSLIDFGDVDALKEFYFPNPVSEFLVNGIPESLGLSGDEDPRWVSEVSFAGSGRFTGTITALTPGQVAAVPEPASWMLMIAGFGLVGAFARRSKGRLYRPA